MIKKDSKMTLEKIEYKGVIYEIAEAGLVSRFRRLQDLRQGRDDPGQEPIEHQVTLCVEWLKQHATERKTVNKRLGSYTLKHVVENWAKTYISNGAFILATRRQGVEIVPHGPDSLNAWFCLAIIRRYLDNCENLLFHKE